MSPASTRPDCRRRSPLPVVVARALVRVYQKLLSPIMPFHCRFYPNCSNYALEALEIHGLIKGTLLTLWRLLRCNPCARGGVDLVPEKKAEKSS